MMCLSGVIFEFFCSKFFSLLSDGLKNLKRGSGLLSIYLIHTLRTHTHSHTHTRVRDYSNETTREDRDLSFSLSLFRIITLCSFVKEF